LKLKVTIETQYYEDLVDENLYVLERYASQKVHQLFRNGIKNISKNEIISIGYEGLYKAATTFDESKNDNFQGYAWYYIDLAFKSYQRKIDGIHHVARNQIKNIRKTTDSLIQKLGRQPTDSEIAERLKIDAREVRKFKNIESNHIHSIQDSSENIKLVDEDNRADTYLEEGERKINLGRDMNDCLENTLTADQRLIIELMYLEYLNAKEIAFKLWGKFDEKEIYLIYNTTKNGKFKLKNCMEKKGWSITDV
jgi:RNA polymerase sigma factor for flagellar operon FliA